MIALIQGPQAVGRWRPCAAVSRGDRGTAGPHHQGGLEDLNNEPLNWDLKALAQARLMDGQLLWVTNVAYLNPTEVVLRYKSLADIERGFHVLSTPRPTT